MTEKEAQREEIARLTREYLARGGEIRQMTCEDNEMYKAPIKRSKRDQIAFVNRRLKVTITR